MSILDDNSAKLQFLFVYNKYVIKFLNDQIVRDFERFHGCEPIHRQELS